MSTEELEAAFRPLDPLGEALHSLHMSGSFYCRSDLTAPWGIDLPPMPESLMFHVVTKGGCWVRLPGCDSHRLERGDFALIPHGLGHAITSDRESTSVNIFELEREAVGPRYELLRHGGGGEPTSLICGAVSVRDPGAQRVVAQLPGIIVVPSDDSTSDRWLGLIRMMTSEAEHLQPGGDTIISRLSDILVVQSIRHWLASDPLARRGWLGALHDDRIGKALALIHRDPTHPWSVEALAEGIGVSRAGFARRFTELVGEPPMHYLRKWRFQVAEGWLRDTDLPLATIAARLDYESEASFSRAFKKTTGRTPGSVRRQRRLETSQSSRFQP